MSIHSMLHFLAVLLCLFPTIIYAGHPKGKLDAKLGQFDANHQKGQLNVNHQKGQLNVNHQKGQLNVNHQKGQLQIRLHKNKAHAYVVIGDHYGLTNSPIRH
jgi:hypothetical protein